MKQDSIRKMGVFDAGGDYRPLISPLRLLFSSASDTRLSLRKLMRLRSRFQASVPLPSRDIAWILYGVLSTAAFFMAMLVIWRADLLLVAGFFAFLGAWFLFVTVMSWAGPSPLLEPEAIIAAYLHVGRCPSCGYAVSGVSGEETITCSECGSVWACAPDGSPD